MDNVDPLVAVAPARGPCSTAAETPEQGAVNPAPTAHEEIANAAEIIPYEEMDCEAEVNPDTSAPLTRGLHTVDVAAAVGRAGRPPAALLLHSVDDDMEVTWDYMFYTDDVLPSSRFADGGPASLLRGLARRGLFSAPPTRQEWNVNAPEFVPQEPYQNPAAVLGVSAAASSGSEGALRGIFAGLPHKAFDEDYTRSDAARD